MPNSELEGHHVESAPTANTPQPHENIHLPSLPDQARPAQSPCPTPFKSPLDTPHPDNALAGHVVLSTSPSKGEWPRTDSPEGSATREDGAAKKRTFFNPLSTEALKAANLTIPTTSPTTSLPRITVLPVDHVVPPTNPATTSKATDDPKDIIEDCERVNEGMLMESNGTSKTTTWAGEGDSKGTTATKKKARKTLCALRWLKQTHVGGSGTEFKNYYDKVLNLKQRKEYHDEAQMLISASKWNGDMDVCDRPVH
ncbi:hypothetical protein BDN67DRAFT_1016323 [Paxillus ammoniavirescens]|nr:hypothetical protein BDN67DRAFT_1016323 [Paxillus ammoniavirescens]